MKNNIKWFFLGALVVLMIVVVIVFINSNGMVAENSMALTGNSSYDYSSNQSKPEISNGISDTTDIDSILGDKVIYTANITLKTDNYTKNIEKIKETITANNAGIANFSENANNSNNKQYMRANIVVRVPQENFKNFTEQIKQLDVYVSSYREDTEDITEKYMDIESKLVSLKQQEQILNDLLSKAKNVNEIIEINNQKQQVIQQIEYNTKMQQTYNNKIAYSTVTINVQEVEPTQVTQKGFGQRLGDTIISGVEGLKFLTLNLLLLIGYLLPFVIVIGIIVLIIVVIVKVINKKRNNKNNE